MNEILKKTGLTTDDLDKLSPMMRQYLETRAAYPDCILFYRLGDFYEMFFDDALTVSKELELTLTGKACGLEERAPMCGVPFHAAESYLTKLVSRGFKVAIGEQTEDPKTAKGLVKREVIRIVTPGTNLNIDALDATRHNFLMCISYQPDIIGIAACDMTTGDFLLTEVGDLKLCLDEMARLAPSEIISNEAFLISGLNLTEIRERYGVAFYTPDARIFDPDACKRTLIRHFRVTGLKALGIERFTEGVTAAGALLEYMQTMQQTDLTNLTRIDPYLPGKYMLLDATTRRNLELTETLRDKSKRGTLLWALDYTCTAMGARMLRTYIEQPLTSIDDMRARQNAVDTLFRHVIPRQEIREYLKPVYDLERLMARITYHTATPKDLLAFGQSVRMLPAVKIVLEDLLADKACAQIYEQIDPLSDLSALIDAAIREDAPLSVREGGIIKDKFDPDIDALRDADTNGRQWLLDLEEEVRTSSGIKNLRIKYSNNFGYSFEVSNAYKGDVPEDFIRRQTLTNCERYTTPRLKELEDMILNAREKLYGLEYEVFCDVRDEIAGAILRIRQTAQALADLDACQSLAEAAERSHYVKPELYENTFIEIKDGRHPVVEKMLDDTGGQFISNDTILDTDDHALMIITGPNMAGKSTYLRQSALIVLMAQIGSFVPAKSARIGIADRIFTRVGASDDLASGRSTFMVEMSEVANILKNATKKSLLILDEIGRGTSTHDGLAIARAVVEYVADRKVLGARTLFATHYHELTTLEGQVEGVVNYCSTVKEQGDHVVFLHKIVRGGADKSYGIQVAKIAGVPKAVIAKASYYSARMAKEEPDADTHTAYGADAEQLSFLKEENVSDPVLKKIKALDVNRLTPIEAMQVLFDLQAEIGAHTKE